MRLAQPSRPPSARRPTGSARHRRTSAGCQRPSRDRRSWTGTVVAGGFTLLSGLLAASVAYHAAGVAAVSAGGPDAADHDRATSVAISAINPLWHTEFTASYDRDEVGWSGADPKVAWGRGRASFLLHSDRQLTSVLVTGVSVEHIATYDTPPEHVGGTAPCAAPLEETDGGNSGAGGWSIDLASRHYFVEVGTGNDSSTAVSSVSSAGEVRESPGNEFVIRPDEHVNIKVDVDAGPGLHAFNLLVAYEGENGPETVKVDSNGSPFLIAAGHDPGIWYEGGYLGANPEGAHPVQCPDLASEWPERPSGNWRSVSAAEDAATAQETSS